jgi:hypothetical protein
MRRPRMKVAAGRWMPISVVLYRRRQPPRRTRQQLPAAVLFLPDLHDADFGVGDLAVELAFRDPKVSHDGIVPEELDRHVSRPTTRPPTWSATCGTQMVAGASSAQLP